MPTNAEKAAGQISGLNKARHSSARRRQKSSSKYDGRNSI